jgi:transposase, IS30 family
VLTGSGLGQQNASTRRCCSPIRQLRTGRALRKPRRRPDQRSERFAGMVMISDRPAEVADRGVPGHWEGDLILGSTESGSAVGTLVERATRFTMQLHLPVGTPPTLSPRR